MHSTSAPRKYASLETDVATVAHKRFPRKYAYVCSHFQPINIRRLNNHFLCSLRILLFFAIFQIFVQHNPLAKRYAKTCGTGKVS